MKLSSIASFDARSIKMQNITRNYPEFPLLVSDSLSTQTVTYGVSKVLVLRKTEMKNCVVWQINLQYKKILDIKPITRETKLPNLRGLLKGASAMDVLPQLSDLQ